jgi:hypothetical protein
MAVNLSFIGGAGWQFFDNNGVMLSGGKLYTYAAGTTTPQATFTSRNGLTANTNPIILDSAGRTPEQIWSTEGILYKYVVETANNQLIRSWDNIGGSVVASNLAQDLAAPSGSTLVGLTGFKGQVGFVQDLADDDGSDWIGFEQASAGAIAISAQDKMRQIVSVQDFGAVGDGVTDDTIAIQTAINASVGKQLMFDGVYKVTSTLTLQSFSHLLFSLDSTIDFSQGGLTDYLFKGDGSAASAILLTANANIGDQFITVANASTLQPGDELLIRSENRWGTANLSKAGEIHYISSIVGNVVGLRDALYDSYTTADSAAVQKITPIKNIIIQNGKFIGGGPRPTTDQIFLGITYGENIRIDGVKTDQFGLHNIELESTVTVFLENCDLGYILQAAQNSYGITLFNACQWVSIANNHFALCRGGISSGGRSTQYGYVRNVAVTGNTFYGILGGAVRAHTGSENWTIVGNTIQAGENQLRPENEGILFRGMSCVIGNNSIYNVDGTAIRCISQITNATRPCSYVITGNQIVRCGRSGIIVTQDGSFPGGSIDGVVIGNNRITEWAFNVAVAAIDVNSSGGDVSNISIVGNVCSKPVGDARCCSIRSFDNTIKNGTISGNVFDNTTSTSETVLLLKDASGSCGGFAINGNRSYGGTYGIRQSNTDILNYVAGNVVSGSVAGLFGFSAPETGGNITI